MDMSVLWLLWKLLGRQCGASCFCPSNLVTPSACLLLLGFMGPVPCAVLSRSPPLLFWTPTSMAQNLLVCLQCPVCSLRPRTFDSIGISESQAVHVRDSVSRPLGFVSLQNHPARLTQMLPCPPGWTPFSESLSGPSRWSGQPTLCLWARLPVVLLELCLPVCSVISSVLCPCPWGNPASRRLPSQQQP